MQYFALHSKKYDLIEVKLTNLKFLIKCLTGQVFVQDCYNELIEMMRDYMNELYNSCKQSFDQASKSLEVLSSEILEEW